MNLLSIATINKIAIVALDVVAEGEKESSILSPDQMAHYAVTAIVTIVNVLIAYFILKLVLFKPLIKVINKRKESIAAQVENAEKQEKEASEKLDEASKRIDASHEEAIQIIADARSQAEKQSQTIIETAKKEAQEIRDRAEEDAKRTRKAMLEEMKDEVADLAVSIAGHVLGTVGDEKKESELRDKVNAELQSTEVKTGE
ncbi:MAG: F0F1 ATP synthase subunit B [Clostridiales bacterium]|nr:F0F1 ATP synthase subunit B [Clostridiales bacterium]